MIDSNTSKIFSLGLVNVGRIKHWTTHSRIKMWRKKKKLPTTCHLIEMLCKELYNFLIFAFMGSVVLYQNQLMWQSTILSVNGFQHPQSERYFYRCIHDFCWLNTLHLSQTEYIKDDTMFIEIIVDCTNLQEI